MRVSEDAEMRKCEYAIYYILFVHLIILFLLLQLGRYRSATAELGAGSLAFWSSGLSASLSALLLNLNNLSLLFLANHPFSSSLLLYNEKNPSL